LQSEVDILSQLDHPNVVKLFEIFDEGDCIYLVLELMDGGEVDTSYIIFCSYSIESLKKSTTLRKRLLTQLGH
jgi:serine/threonine protein kinase